MSCFDRCVVPLAQLVPKLGLDVDDLPICHACLSFVVFAIEAGDECEIRRWTNRMGPDLWAEGLEQPVRLALKRALRRGVQGAAEALADVDRNGPRGATVRAIVRWLGAQLSARAQGDLLKMGFESWPST